MSVATPDHDIVHEARRVLDAATDIHLRLLGGLVIEVSLPGPLRRRDTEEIG
jgi:hypothetical protein